jgi:outer membrane protein TolC
MERDHEDDGPPYALSAGAMRSASRSRGALCLVLAQAQEQEAASLINLYTALGGGWQP